MTEKKRKKILILSSFPAPYRVDVFQGLAQTFDVDVFFSTGNDQNRSKEYFVSKDVFRFYMLSEPKDVLYFSECVRKLKQYNLVLAYDWYLPFAMKVELQCVIYKIPYVVNCDGAFIDKSPNIMGKLKDFVKRYFITHAAKCFASGVYAKAYFQYYGAPEENIVIHNFSSLHKDDILRSCIPQEEKDSLCLELKLEIRKTVLAIGQFIPRKGFDVLLDAWGDLDNDNQLVIIGGGDEQEKYEKIIRKYHYEHVKLIGFKTKSEIFKYYKASNLFVMPTRDDIWGLVINEAMACGLPIVATDKCIAANEMIENGVNGYIIGVDCIEELHELMAFVLLNNLENSIGQKNLEKASGYVIEEIVKGHTREISCL